jgi:hypothetical protein
MPGLFPTTRPALAPRADAGPERMAGLGRFGGRRLPAQRSSCGIRNARPLRARRPPAHRAVATVASLRLRPTLREAGPLAGSASECDPARPSSSSQPAEKRLRRPGDSRRRRAPLPAAPSRNVVLPSTRHRSPEMSGLAAGALNRRRARQPRASGGRVISSRPTPANTTGGAMKPRPSPIMLRASTVYLVDPVCFA